MDEHPPAPSCLLAINRFTELREALDHLNYDLGASSTAITSDEGRSFWFAFCTDPDGHWCLESGDPRERMTDSGYEALPVEAIAARGPWRILWAPGT